MWIKKLYNSLYGSIVMRMSIAALIGLFVAIILLLSTSQYSLSRNREFWKANYTEIEEFAEEIERLIDTENLTYKQASEYEFSDIEIGIPVIVSFYSNYSDILDEVDYIYEFEMLREGYFFEFSFIDGNGFMVVYSQDIEEQTDLFILLSIVISIVLFFTLSFYLIFRKLAYIRTIEEGIYNISHGEIRYKIPLHGRNELTRLAGSINEMGDMLSKNIEHERQHEANQRLLITNMSHDIKTPLTSMTGYIDVIQTKLTPDHEAYPLICIAKKNGQRLEKLISDLFLYSKLISKDIAINMQNININVMLKQIIEIRTENIVLNEVEKNITANIDPEQFHRVIDNLISNATKYGIDSGIITIIVGLLNDEVIIEVKNLTNENLEDKIEQFTTRLYTGCEDRNNGSSGLGLSIVTELLNVMNGKLNLGFKNGEFTARISLKQM